MSELLVIFVIVVLLFGTKKLGSLGSDLGSAIRGFRNAMQPEEKPLGHGVANQADARESDAKVAAPRDA